MNNELLKNKAKQSQFVFFTAAAFPLTLTTERDYNEIFSKMSYLERTPIERGWKWIRTI